MNAPLRAYLLANVAFLVPAGVQMIVFLWLVTVWLAEPPERVGIAQMTVLLPGLLLMLLAGVIGDRFDQRRILVATHLAVALPVFAMAGLVAAGALTFTSLLALSLLAGVAGTFSGPPRDAMLSRVAGADIQRTVFLVIGLQFAAQLVGFALASATDRIGAEWLLALAATLYALGALPCLRLPAGVVSSGVRRHPLREFAEGFSVAVRSPRIWPALVLTFALGIFFAGSFVVLLPLIVRDVYHGGAAEISLAFGCNMLGTVVMIGVLLRRGGVHHQGRAFMGGLLFGCIMLSFLYLHPPAWAFFLLSFVWGLGGGLTMTMGRAIVQESAPTSLGARLLSLYAFGMTAGMPIGSVSIGYAVAAFGPLEAVWVPAIGMGLTVLVVHLTSDFWRVRATVGTGAGALSATP